MPDSAANLAVYQRQTGSHGGSGYPLLRLLAVVACGSRTVIDAVFGPMSLGEIGYVPRLLGCLRPGMLLPADRNFDVADLITRISGTGADLLIRGKKNRVLPQVEHLSDGSWLTTLGGITLRVVAADIVVRTGATRRTGRYRLITTLTDHRAFPATDIVTLYHQRWGAT